MAGQKQKKTQKARKHKVSRHINGGGGKMDRDFSEVEKVLLGQGMMNKHRIANIKRIYR